jgi:GNAT superfamily N-acetyltransferase
MIELLQHGALVEGKEDPADEASYLAALAETQATSGNHLLVAEVDGEVVGMGQLVIFRHFQHRGGLCAEIESLHVHPDFRSQGIGKRLVNAVVDVAREAGCFRIQLTSDLRRSEAHRFYERLDFEPSHVGFKRVLPASD